MRGLDVEVVDLSAHAGPDGQGQSDAPAPQPRLLAALGYDAEWHCIPAAAIGAPHRRDRIWIIAHFGSIGLAQRSGILTRRQISDTADQALDKWNDLSEVGRAFHGLPNRVDRIKALGNAVVPQIPELIGKAIMQAEGMTP